MPLSEYASDAGRLARDIGLTFGTPGKRDLPGTLATIDTLQANDAKRDAYYKQQQREEELARFLADGNIDLDSPEWIRSYSQQLEKMAPGEGMKVGETLLKGLMSRKKDLAQAGAYNQQANSYRGKTLESLANARKTNTGIDYINKGYKSGEINNAQAGGTLFGHSIPKTPKQQLTQAENVANIKAQADRDVARIKAGGKGDDGVSPGFSAPAKLTPAVLNAGAAYLKAGYPQMAIEDNEGNLSPEAARLIGNLYQRGMAFAKQRNMPVNTVDDIFRIGDGRGSLPPDVDGTRTTSPVPSDLQTPSPFQPIPNEGPLASPPPNNEEQAHREYIDMIRNGVSRLDARIIIEEKYGRK